MKVLGYAPGAYDIFHVGHLNLLRGARSRCDYLVAGVVSDEVLAAAKGRLPVIPLAERLEIVASMRYVDEAVVDAQVDKFLMWSEIQFDILFKGDDWKGTERGQRLEADLASVGSRVEYLPYTRSVSSSSLRELISRAA